MSKGRNSSDTPSGSGLGNVVIGIGVLAFCAFLVVSAQNRINDLHLELFNSNAPITYDVDFENMVIVATARITSLPRPNSKWKDFPLMSQSQVYRVTHKIGFGSHTGTIELKTADNGQGSEFLSSDILMEFSAESANVNIGIASLKYDTPEFRLHAENLSGSYTWAGKLSLKAKSLELKMVNYAFNLNDVIVEFPADQKSINVLASKIKLDEVVLGHSKIAFTGINPFEVNLDSTFNSQPVEVKWNVQKASIQDQEVRINSGKISFPVAMLDAYVGPRVDRDLMSAEKESKSNTSEKIRFLFSAAKEVSLGQAKAVALRQFARNKNISREGDFYKINVEKEDAFKAMEDKTRKLTERKSYLESWATLPSDKMYEEAFFGVVFGDFNRAAAVKELLAMKLKDDNSLPLYQAVKARSALRDALISYDDYDSKGLEVAASMIKDVTTQIPDHKLSLLLRLELAKAQGDKKLAFQLYDQFATLEQDQQIRMMFEFMKHLHVDNGKALESLIKAHALDPKSFYVQNFLRNKIHIYQHTGDKPKLEEDYKSLILTENAAPLDLVAYSTLLREKNELTEALKVIDLCFDQDAGNKNCNDEKENLMTLIGYEKQKENPEAAVQYLQDLLVDRPASIPVNAGLGFVYKLKGELEKSITHYSIACALGGSFACIEAGENLSRRNEAEKAILMFDVSCDLQSGSGCLKAGLHTEKSGELERSGNYFDRACNQFNDNVGCYHLARNLQLKRMPNKDIVPYLNRACKLYDSACKLATVYRTSNKQPPIPAEPK